MKDYKVNKRMFIFGIVFLLILVSTATYAYFSVTTVNNFGTSTINAQAGNIGSIALNGTNTNLNMSITALDMAEGDYSKTYYASTNGKTVKTTTAVLGTASVSPTSDNTTYHCTYTLSVTHTGTNDMYNKFNSKTNNTYDYTNRSTNQIVLTINGTDYDFYDGWPTNNQVNGDFYITGNQTKDITARLMLTNHSDIDQTYLANTDISISISLVSNSLSCEPVNSSLTLTYVDPSLCTSLTQICEVSIAGENFYVVSSDSTNTVLLSKYDLKNDGNGSYMQDTSGTDTNVIKTRFSNTNYWDNAECVYTWPPEYTCSTSSGILSQYSNAANPTGTHPYTSPYPYIYDYNSTIYPYIESYVKKLSSITGVSIEGRLLKKEETSGMGNILKDKNDYYYWLGSGNYNWDIFVIGVYGQNDDYYDDRLNIRPVIIVRTSDLQ